MKNYLKSTQVNLMFKKLTWLRAKTIHTYIYIIFESGSWPIER